MKVKLWSAILCSCLFLGLNVMRAQTAPVASDSSMPDDSQAQQTPAQTPPQNPPQTAPGTPTIPKPTVQLPPAAPQETQPSTIPVEHDTEGDYFSIMPIYWLTKTSPVMSPANGNDYIELNTANQVIGPGSLHFPGHSKYGEGIMVTVPTSRENSIQFSYYRIRGANNSYLPEDVNFFGNGFNVGDFLYSEYNVQISKLSWNYLTWPYPSKGAKLRIKSLWEVQYVNMSTSFNAPADTTAVETYGSKRVIFPTFGIGAEYHVSKRFYINLKVSAFGFPHHADIVDSEGELVFRLKHAEAMLGDKYYHFKTSPGASDEYFSYTLSGPFLGLRYTWR